MRRAAILALTLTPILATFVACSGNDGTAPPVQSTGDAGATDAASAPDASSGNDAGDDDAAADARTTTGDDASDASATGDDAATDAGDDASDAGTSDASDAATDASDAGVAPAGTLLASNLVGITGVSSDGYVFFNTSDTVSVVPVAGGHAATAIALRAGMPDVYVRNDRPGALLSVRQSPPSGTPFNALSAWTASHGYQSLNAQAIAAQFGAEMTPDGASVVFVQRPAVAGAWSVGVARTDGSGSTPLPADSGVHGVPSVWTTADGKLVATYPLVTDDAGTTKAQVAAFDATTHARTLSFSSTAPAVLDLVTAPVGSQIWMRDAAGGHLLDATTGALVASDPAAAYGGVFDPSGAHLFYITSGVSLAEIGAGATTPSTVVASVAQYIDQSMSPDGTKLLFQDAQGFLRAISTASPTSAAWPIWTASTVPGGYTTPGGAFTADSRNVVVNLNQGTYAIPALGDAPTMLLSQQARSWQPATGSKIVALANDDTLQVLDASNASPPVTLASQVASFAMSHDGSRVVYQTTGGALYGAAIP